MAMKKIWGRRRVRKWSLGSHSKQCVILDIEELFEWVTPLPKYSRDTEKKGIGVFMGNTEIERLLDFWLVILNGILYLVGKKV